VDAAIVVYLALGTQVPKCTARATPASAQPSTPRRPSRAISARRVTPAAGASTPTANALRQNAIASAGAVA
jgi:hypothetical protein